MADSELTSKFVAQARRLPCFLQAVASVSLLLQLQNGYAQNAPGQVPLNTETDAARESIISVKEYGAVGDGVTDDTTAFVRALAVCAERGGTCLVPEGRYLISASGFSQDRKRPSVLSGVHLTGAGREKSILKVAGMPTAHFLQCEGDNWSVENLTFDMGDHTPSAVLAAITCKGNNWRVANCAVLKSGRWGIAAFGGSNWSIEGNHISRTVPGASPPTGAILVSASKGVWSSNGRIINNICEGAGISFAGSDGIIARNRVSRSGSGSGIFVGGLPSTRSPNVTDNICTGGSSGYDAAQGKRWWSVSGFEIWGPNAVISNNIAHDNDGGGFAIGGQNSLVIGNKAYNNGGGAPGRAGFNARTNRAAGAAASHSIFIGNAAYDTRYPSPDATQDYGYQEQGGGLVDIKHFGNNYDHNRRGPAKYNSTGGQPNVSQAEGIHAIRALAEDIHTSDAARRALREYLDRVSER